MLDGLCNENTVIFTPIISDQKAFRCTYIVIQKQIWIAIMC